MILDIATQFSPYPSGRFPRDGSANGEAFRKNILVPSLIDARSTGRLFVHIDGVRTFGSSFLEEAFGGLVREEGFTAAELASLMEIVCTKNHLAIYKEAIAEYIAEADRDARKAK